MDREKQDELPRLQMEWIDGICLPLYKVRIGSTFLVISQIVESYFSL